MKLKVYELKTDRGGWLGTIVLSDDGKYFSLTDWGNINFHWDVKGEQEFEDFILKLNTDYFGEKMYIGVNYIARDDGAENRCRRYADKILPALQEEIKRQRQTNL